MATPTTVPSMLKKTEFDSLLCFKLQKQRKDEELIDCIIHLETEDNETKTFKAHRIVLASGSQYFKELLKNEKTDSIKQVNLKLCFENAACCFESLLNFLYSGCLDMSKCTPSQMLKVAKLYRITEAEELLQPYCQDVPLTDITSLPVLFSSPLFSSQSATLEALLKSSAASHAQTLQTTLLEIQMKLARLTAQKLAQPLFASQTCDTFSLPFNLQTSVQHTIRSPQSLSRKRKRSGSQNCDENLRVSKQAICSSDSYLDSSIDNFYNMGDIIVPSSDREGWCRNKKYIEQVKNGFMCTVCKKIYGRYNSVSYHVTIYHRNPPIKCDIEGCQFSTREARYIHFHKFYRHHIPLPDTIDLGCRKCPFCTHVSKSPAMLQKHISRHFTESNRSVSSLQCSQCDEEISDRKKILEHMLKHQNHIENNIPGFPCQHCSYRGQSETSLQQHLLFKHSDGTFERKLSCDVCQYVCAESKMQKHYKDRHPQHKQESEEESAIENTHSRSTSPMSNAPISVIVS